MAFAASLSSVNAIGRLLGMGLLGSLLMLPMFLQSLMGYSAMLSGEPHNTQWPRAAAVRL